MREIEETNQFYFAKNPPPHTLVKDKVLYVYSRITQTIALTPMFFDKFTLLYEPMEEQVVQDMTWNHGVPILELVPKVATSTQPRGDVHGERVVDGVIPNSLEAKSSRARTQNARRPLVPSAPPAPIKKPISTFVPIDG